MDIPVLQVLFSVPLIMVLFPSGSLCQNELSRSKLDCQYSGNDGRRDFMVDESMQDGSLLDIQEDMQSVSIGVFCNITCGTSVPLGRERRFLFEIVYPDESDEWRILLSVSKQEVHRDIIVEAHGDDDDEKDSISSGSFTSIDRNYLLSSTNMLFIVRYLPSLPRNIKNFTIRARAVKVIEIIEAYEDYLPCKSNDGDSHESLGADGNFEFSCNTYNSSYDNALVSIYYEISRKVMTHNGHLKFVCAGFEGEPVDILKNLRVSCNRTPEKLSIHFAVSENVEVEINSMLIETFVYGRESSTESASGISSATEVVVPITVLLVAVLTVVIVATVLRKRRKNLASTASDNPENVGSHFSGVNGPYQHDCGNTDAGDATHNGPRYVTANTRSVVDGHGASNTVCQNDDTTSYNEIGEQDYNVLFAGKEKGDYHEYNVPDSPQGRAPVSGAETSGSSLYQELFKDGNDDRSTTSSTGARHIKTDDHHSYQDLRQDDSNVSDIRPDDEQPSKESTHSVKNIYQALKDGTPVYATLESGSDYTPLQQREYSHSTKSTTGVKGTPSHEPTPPAGCGTVELTDEADADYESPDEQPKTASVSEEPLKEVADEPYDHLKRTECSETLSTSQPAHKQGVSIDRDDFHIPDAAAEDLLNTYQTLNPPGSQQKPDTDAEEYSHLERSLKAKSTTNPAENQYGKLDLNDAS